jgi:Protein involved in cell division
MQEYKYYYEGASFYCYPDSAILINKYDIKNEDLLNRAERKLTELKAVELVNNPVKGNFDFKHFCDIHKFLFEDIYEWAGQKRKGGFMSKGSTVFAKSEFIESSFNEYYERLVKDNFLKSLDKDAFCKSLAYYMSEINKIHPFREGNGRTSKIYFEQLAENAGYDLDFSMIDKDELILADVLSYRGNYALSIEILNQAVTPLL